jgi:hypothetical protein
MFLNNADIKISKSVKFVLIFAFLSSLLNVYKYASDSLGRGYLLSKLPYEGRCIYIDGIYNRVHGGTGYEFSLWADRIIPKEYSYTLHRSPDDPSKGEEKYDFWNYFAWLNYGLYPRVTKDYYEPNFPPPYGNIVFSISLKPSQMHKNINGILFTSIDGNKYYVAARFHKDIHLLIKEPFFNNTIAKDPSRWGFLNSKFKELYPGKTIRSFLERK